MSRFAKITQNLNLKGHGLEVGPSHNPVLKKKDGFKVSIIDHMSREQLIEKYTGHGLNLENIEEVDYVWSGESYLELTKKPKHFDWIIASHVIEHTPDLIGFLKDCDSILNENGAISLVIPDKRYCFDYCRPVSSLGGVVDAHLARPKYHSPGTVAEYFLNVSLKGNVIAWSEGSKGEITFMYSKDLVLEHYQTALKNDSYIDVHRWCFVPHAFRLLIHDLNMLGFLEFKEMAFHKTDGCEFFLTLSKKGHGPKLSRLEMVEEISRELAATTNKSVNVTALVWSRLCDLPRRIYRKLKNLLLRP